MTEKKIRIISCLLSFILGVGIGVGGYGISQIFEARPQGVIYADNGGMVLPDQTANNGISLLSTRIAPSDYEQYGISPQAENAYTVTAKVIPEEAMLTNLIWSLAWSNTSSWANENGISTYLTVTPSADTRSCTVFCFKLNSN